MPARFVILFVAFLLKTISLDAQVVISEFLALNDNGLVDGDGDASDWIEIHNPGSTRVDLTGFFLTDDPDNLSRWAFPANTALDAGAYLIVFASGKAAAPAGELHANFRLAGGGEFLALVAADGSTVIDGYLPAYPQQYPDTSYGISPDGNAKYFLTPSPGIRNSGGLGDPQSRVEFSPPSGTLTAATMVELHAANPEAQIRYTTDGSDPDESSPLYEAPLSLNSTLEVRARLFVPGQEPGPVNSAGYIRLRSDVQEFHSPLPIVVVENLGAGPIPDKRASNPPAGDGGGIRQVPRQPAFLAIFEPGNDGLARLASDPNLTTRMGIRVRGSSSASQPAKKENYSLEAWSATDEEQIDIQPLGLPPDNDFVLYAPYRYDRALIRNAWVYETMRLMGHYAARTRFVEVFVNTEGDALSMNDFAGVFVFMEKIKQARERVDIDALSPDGSEGGWLLESNRLDPLPEDGSNVQPFNFHTAGPNRRKEGPYGGSSSADRGGDDIPTGYNTFLNFVEPTGYETTRAQRESIIAWFDAFEETLYGPDWRNPSTGYRRFLDIDSFIDHWIMVNLTRNVDGLQLSTFLYRPSTYGKLHLNPVWDYDRSIDSYDGRDDSTTGMWGRQFLWFPRLFADPEFAQHAVDRWQELRQGVLSTRNIFTRIDAMADEITQPVAEANFERWPSNNTPRGGSWPAEIDHLKTWLAARAEWIDRQYSAPPEFRPDGGRHDGAVDLTLRSSEAGTIYYTLDGSDPRSADLPGTAIELVPEFTGARGLVPTVENGGAQLGTSWKGGSEPFDDSAWMNGSTGLGIEYPGLVGIDSSAMLGVTASAYLRVPFELEASTLASLNELTLNMKYEDGFVAWINGVEVASANRPADLTWDAAATASNRDLFAVEFAPYNVHLSALRAGENILAIQAMNSSADNADILALPQLVAQTGSSGGPSSGAIPYEEPLRLDEAAVITARLETNGAWSGPVRTSYLVNTTPASTSNLVISEIMYRPADANTEEEQAGISDRDEFEFLELLNVSATETIDLVGLRFAQVDVSGDRQGIDFEFTLDRPVTFLRPGERVVIVENEEAFRLRYGPAPRVAGQYRNALSNDGERITLLDSEENELWRFSYNDQLPWPPGADGDGYSLVLQSPFSLPDPSLGSHWLPSAHPNGSPGISAGIPFAGEAGEDRDGDGLPALLEHALGSDDLDVLSGPDSFAITTIAEGVEISHSRNLLDNDAVLVIETSVGLVDWLPGTGAESEARLTARHRTADGTETLTWRFPRAPPKQFFRLRASLP